MAMVVPFLIGARLSSSGGVGEGHRRGDAGGTSDVVTLEGLEGELVTLGQPQGGGGGVAVDREGEQAVGVDQQTDVAGAELGVGGAEAVKNL